MITVSIYRNKTGQVCGFQADDHGKELICAAVSTLAINCVNSIEQFTDELLVYDYHTEGGFLYCELPAIQQGKRNRDAELLLNSLLLGLNCMAEEYPEDIRILDQEVQNL